MKTITLTDNELKLVEKSLDFMFNSAVKLIENNRELISEEYRKGIVNDLIAYSELVCKIKKGEVNVETHEV